MSIGSKTTLLQLLALAAGVLVFAGASSAAANDQTIAVVESISATSAPPGGSVTISFSGTNTAASAQTPFSLVFFLGPSWTVGDPPSGCSRPDPYTIDCELASLGAGASTPTYSVTATVDASVQPGTILNSRALAFAGGTSGGSIGGDARSLMVLAPAPPPPPPPLSPSSLSVALRGSGTGTVASAPGGITCTPNCAANYVAGTTVTLTATPAAGSVFAGWTDACAAAGTQPACTIVVNGDTGVGATFDLTPPTTTTTNTTTAPAPPPCVVPALHALTLNAARARLSHGHCSLGTVTRRPSSASLVGRVMSQHPAPGTQLLHLAKVAVVLGRHR